MELTKSSTSDANRVAVQTPVQKSVKLQKGRPSCSCSMKVDIVDSLTKTLYDMAKNTIIEAKHDIVESKRSISGWFYETDVEKLCQVLDHGNSECSLDKLQGDLRAAWVREKSFECLMGQLGVILGALSPTVVCEE
jgi:hypothetical protein